MDTGVQVTRGDLITVLMYRPMKRPSESRPPRAMRARVILTTNAPITHEPVFLAKAIAVADQWLLYPRDEGVRWIRGHHREDSAEVKALLVANALASPTR